MWHGCGSQRSAGEDARSQRALSAMGGTVSNAPSRCRRLLHRPDSREQGGRSNLGRKMNRRANLRGVLDRVRRLQVLR
jgi:hypothetical protein